MSKYLTHKGIIKGSNACVAKDYRREVLLRETKLWWVTFSGVKYRKENGLPPMSDMNYHNYKLILSSVEELPDK